MEKKVRVKKLNHQDDVKRSWAAAYPLIKDFEVIKDFEGILPEDLEETPSQLEPVENNTPQIQPSVKWHDDGISEK